MFVDFSLFFMSNLKYLFFITHLTYQQRNTICFYIKSMWYNIIISIRFEIHSCAQYMAGKIIHKYSSSTHTYTGYI